MAPVVTAPVELVVPQSVRDPGALGEKTRRRRAPGKFHAGPLDRRIPHGQAACSSPSCAMSSGPPITSPFAPLLPGFSMP